MSMDAMIFRILLLIGPSFPALSPSCQTPSYLEHLGIDGRFWKDNQSDPYYPALKLIPARVKIITSSSINIPVNIDATLISDYEQKSKLSPGWIVTPVQNAKTGRWHTKVAIKKEQYHSNTIESFYNGRWRIPSL